MGNMAVITASKAADVAASTDLGVCLRWNGGRDSVEAFLIYCRIHGFQGPAGDSFSGWERLVQVLGNFFMGEGINFELGRCCDLACDNGAHGTYIIEGWEIVGRRYFDGCERSEFALEPMLLYIDERQPAWMRLGAERIAAAVASLEGGDSNV